MKKDFDALRKIVGDDEMLAELVVAIQSLSEEELEVLRKFARFADEHNVPMSKVIMNATTGEMSIEQ